MAALALAAATSAPAQDDSVDNDEMPSDQGFGMGLIPDAPAVVRSLPRVARYRAFLPVSVDLSSKMPLPGDQKKLGSCASWAVAYAARSYYTTEFENRSSRLPANIPSPLYTWQLAHTGACDQGSSFEDVVNVLRGGAPSLKTYPYTPSCSRPSTAQIEAARDFRVRGLSKIDETNADDIRGELAKGNPVLFALQVGPGWAYDRTTHGVRNGYLLEGRDEAEGDSYHAMTLIGYDDRRQAFRLINSWGRHWGDHGYAWMSYDFVRHQRIKEALVLDVEPPAPKPPSPQPPEPQPAPQPDPIPAPSPPAPQPVPVPPEPHPQPLDITTLQCAHISLRQENGRVNLFGFVQSVEDLQRVRVAFDPGKTNIDLRVLPFPLCEAAQTLEKPLIDPDTPQIEMPGGTRFKAGDTLSFRVRSTQSLRFLYVFYFSHDGDVQTLVQPNGFIPIQSPPHELYTFGDGLNGRQKYTVSAPFGDEMVVALASKSPLFERKLPSNQTEREFLSELRRQILYKPNPSLPDREISASLTTLVTVER